MRSMLKRRGASRVHAARFENGGEGQGVGGTTDGQRSGDERLSFPISLFLGFVLLV